ncbi:uncharacterized protein K489DRAFT_180505 [Dissoconium aciculare CBS 342.82]|uniref:Uncharacterized protein n=1 Tax=Dissoconium aciculare CBS 342.82 TaxID=1314786 RepID=A0A6J3M9P8_9PEZI|nr:uncharacterized protein K489DRAFT_180505 [Dissoconium aciculare CBS 342.82]KAF1824344.1 hypothetical protein K489DRAFT_180505 [Dissoconium aciculare CBS 342.82]
MLWVGGMKRRGRAVDLGLDPMFCRSWMKREFMRRACSFRVSSCASDSLRDHESIANWAKSTTPWWSEMCQPVDVDNVRKRPRVQVLMEWIVSSSELRVESKPRNDVAPYSFLAWNFLTIIVYLREALEILRHAWEISSPWVVHLPSLISYNNHHHPA